MLVADGQRCASRSRSPIAASLVRGRRARTRVADVVVEPRRPRRWRAAPAAMRRALADPSVRAAALVARARRLPRRGRRRGCPARARRRRSPPPCSSATASRSARWSTTPRCARSPSCSTRSAPPRGWRSTTSGWPTRCAARLDEVHASRQRIVAAGDAERRRLERDLHDGAQQRLVALALRLRTLERRAAGGGDVALADELEASPASSTRRWRASASSRAASGRRCSPRRARRRRCEALADRAPLPVDLDVRARRPAAGRRSRRPPTSPPARRSPTCSSTPTRSASRLARRTRTARLVLTRRRRRPRRRGREPRAAACVGLADRLDALGGSLIVESPPGGGTTVVRPHPAAREPPAASRAGR